MENKIGFTPLNEEELDGVNGGGVLAAISYLQEAGLTKEKASQVAMQILAGDVNVIDLINYYKIGRQLAEKIVEAIK